VDDDTLRSLKVAYAATPQNVKLFLVLANAHLERSEPDEARVLLEAADLTNAETEDRHAVAEICIAVGQPEGALRLAADDSAEALVLQARAHLALGDTESGRSVYRLAVQLNPTLEDPALAQSLSMKIRDVAGGDRPRLRVISKDDTVDAEAENLLVPDPEPVDFSRVGGLEGVKKQIHRKIILPFQKPSLFKRFRKRVGGGILLYGPPGCGKTLLARATAGECKATFYNVAIAEVLDMYIGESEQKLHALFEKARTTVPAVIFFDELEALGGKRQFNREATSSKLKRIPTSPQEFTEEQIEEVEGLIDRLEDDEDVQAVYTNIA
jgi:transitional endoplasmic reticulum ATPase